MDNDRFIEFLKLLDKIYNFPNMNLTQKEIELIKEGLKAFFDNLNNYGPQTKKIIKEMIDNENDFKQLYYKVYDYMATNDIRK